MEPTDYTNSGFDNFLTRGNSPNLGGGLDDQNAMNNSIPFDRTQTTGSIGDSFNLGGIGMSSKDNAITLNDGQLVVNDTSTNSQINASSGNITYIDSTGNLVVQEGILPDGATGIRIVDKQQVGIAQFGRFKDGSTALKVAKPNIEVSTARDDQLIFNSAQNVLKVVKIMNIRVSLAYTTNATPNGNQFATATFPHGLSFMPSYIANIVQDPSIESQNASPGGLHYSNWAMAIGWVGAHLVSYCTTYVTVDTTNVYITTMMDTQAFSNGTYVPTATVYLMQESFTAT